MRLRRYEFTRWAANKTSVEVERVEFTHNGDIVFWTGDILILAVKFGDWNNLHEVIDTE
jgi:hypothetical protein